MKKLWALLLTGLLTSGSIIGCVEENKLTDTESGTDSDSDSDTDTDSDTETVDRPDIEYMVDDGTAERAIALFSPKGTEFDDIMWWGHYLEAEGTTTLHTIKIAFGAPYYIKHKTETGLSIGDPFTVYILEDPNDDTIPGDLEVLYSQDSTISSFNENIFQEIILDKPVEVHNEFFLLATYHVTLAVGAPGARDLNASDFTCWFGAGTPAVFDVGDLFGTSNSFMPQKERGAFLLRAIGK